MKKLIISGLAVILHCAFLNAQEVRTFSGRVTDSNGDGIEYVSIGVPNDTIFTVSDINGYFRFRLPDSDTRGIVFSHLSYDPFTLDPPEAGSGTEGLSIILDYHELPEAVVLPDDGKKVTVLGKGVRWAGAGFGLSNSLGGILNEEWGSKVRLRKPTRIEKAIIKPLFSRSLKSCSSTRGHITSPSSSWSSKETAPWSARAISKAPMKEPVTSICP